MTKVFKNFWQMYKVFFNDRIVFIGSTFKKSLIKNGLVFHVSNLKEMESTWLLFRDDGQLRNLILMTDNPEDGKEMFFSLFSIINAAGGVVSNSENQILCIYRWGKWDLPKGKAEKDEKMEDTAIREVEEECGISDLRNDGLNSITYHIYEHPRKPGNWILKQTYWFDMFYGGTQMLVPQINEDIVEAKWFAKSELGVVVENTWSSLKPLIMGWANSA
jgi:8-oxo-dGTP pyrophosphatase MutT (NUDIX family)